MDNNILEVRTSEIMGRYLTAKKQLQPGELIIDEMPLMIGPPLHSGLVCLGCNQKVGLSESQYRCPGCRWPFCSPKCQGMYSELGHSEQECKILSERNIIDLVTKSHVSKLTTIYEVILSLRCLYLKQQNKKKWSILVTMESHNDLRKTIAMHWYRNQFHIVDQIREDWQITEFSEEDIHTICGIIKVNCFGVGRQGCKGRCLYPTTSIMAHDCSPNSRIILDTNTFSVNVRVTRNIDEGETISISYVDVFMTTLQRRDELKNAKFFWCTCRRCSDPTEFGTFCSALLCTRCSKSTVLPTDPLNQKADWRCSSCDLHVDADIVASILVLLPEEFEAIDVHDISTHEKFIQRYSRILGDNHYFLLSAKYAICQSYRPNGVTMDNTASEELLERKEKYCRQILNTIDVLVPGQSRVKGIIMYELYFTLMLISARKMQAKEISKKEFRQIMHEAVPFLKESEEILKWEPEGSVSRKKADDARAILDQLNCDTVENNK